MNGKFIILNTFFTVAISFVTLNAQSIKYYYNKAGFRVAHQLYTIEPQIAVTPSSFILEKEAGTKNITISNQGAKDLQWKVSSTAGWLRVQGDSTGTNMAEVTFSFEENTGELRKAELIITAEGAVNSPFPVHITQKGFNTAPEVVNPIEDIQRYEGFAQHVINFSEVFLDADGDTLTYSVETSNGSIVSAAIEGHTLIINEAGLGTALITLTATDPSSESVSDEFHFSVLSYANNSPYLLAPLNDIVKEAGFVSFTLDINNTFLDPDDDLLTYSVDSENEDVVTVSAEGSVLTFLEQGTGFSIITVWAEDMGGEEIQDQFIVQVVPANSLSEARDDGISIFPNPATDRLYINLNDGATMARIDILDIHGMKIYSGYITGTSLAEIGLNDYTSGLYIIQLRFADRMVSRKFIIK